VYYVIERGYLLLHEQRKFTLLHFFDATKAFDKVEYCSLFRELLETDIPLLVIRVLLYIYTEQQVRVLWKCINSTSFSVSNGVKQGNMTIKSPILFCVCYDYLLLALRSKGEVVLLAAGS
jgi:hypothetical protein